MISNVIFTIFIPAFLSIISYIALRPEWIEETKVSWGRNLFVSALFSIALTTPLIFLGPTQNIDPRLIGISIIAWLVPLIFITDLTTYKIPRGVSKLAILGGLIVAIWASTITNWQAVFISIGITSIIPAALFFVKGIGLGDIRIIQLFAVALPWWVTVQGWFHAFILATVIGLIHVIVANIFNLGFKTIDTSPTFFTKLSFMIRRKPLPEKVKKKIIPFGPALIIGFLVYAIYNYVFLQSINLPAVTLGFM